MQTDLYKLGLGVAIAFVMPLVVYVVGLVWIMTTGARNLEKLWRMFCLIFPIFSLGLMLATHFDVIRGVWEQSRVFALVTYSVLGVVVPYGLVARHTPLAYIRSFSLRFATTRALPVL